MRRAFLQGSVRVCDSKDSVRVEGFGVIGDIDLSRELVVIGIREESIDIL